MWYVKAVFNTPGVGGTLACVVIICLIVSYGLTIRWISKGYKDTAKRHD